MLWNMVTYSHLSLAYKSSYNVYTFYHWTWWTLCSLSNAFSLENSKQFTLLMGKWYVGYEAQKEGVFPP